MASEVKEKLNEIGIQILTASKHELYLSMRFLDLPLSSLTYQMNMSTFFVATDGECIYFQPRFLMERYEYDRVIVNRAYLHMLLHCILRHVYNIEDRDEELWNLSCDIAVEAIVDELDYSALKQVVSDQRIETYEWLKSKLNVLTAEGIYHCFKTESVSTAQIISLSTAFLVDDHIFWKSKKMESQKDGESSKQENSKSNQNNSKDGQSDSKSDQSDSKSSQNDSEKDQSDSKKGDNDAKTNQNDLKNSQYSGENQNDDIEKRRQNHRVKKQQARNEEIEKWRNISEKLQTNLETFSKNIGKNAKGLMRQLAVENREQIDYHSFLRKFAVLKEEMLIDMDAFDYAFYQYGIEMYGDMPLIEELEYKEVRRIEQFVIAIDTSGSISVDTIKRFLEETVTILKSVETFSKKVVIHLIQCDMEIKSDDVIITLDELQDYIQEFEIKGRGGTDFRPVFDYINELQQKKELKELKGLLYFTDGYGSFPKKKPPYDVAFIFTEEIEEKVPAWAMKVVLPS